jgi:ligand-binding sensor domain-containing protein
MNWNKAFTTLLLAGWVTTLAGIPAARGQEPFFSVLPFGNEINNVVLQTFFQDTQGFIWLGTSKGLYRFDGTKCMQVPADDSLKDYSCTALFEDKNSTIWAGTGKGKILKIRNGRAVLFNPMEGYPVVSIKGIVQDTKGNMWFSTYGEGVYYWNGSRLYNIDTDDGLGDNFTYVIVADHSGNVWVGTDGGISVCSFVNGKKQVHTINSSKGLPDNIVLSMVSDGDNTMWAGMQDGGICKIDVKTSKIERIPGVEDSSTGPVNDLVIAGHRLWAASETGGIISLDPRSPSLISKFTRIVGKDYVKMNKVLLDIHDNIWFLTGNALIRTTGEKLEFLSSDLNPAFSNIKSIITGRKGDLWFSNDKGLYHLLPGNKGNTQPELFISHSKYPGSHIISLYEDRDGFVWAGTFGNGLFRLDTRNGKIHHYTEHDGLANNNVLSITGVGNEVWLATLGGVSRCPLPVAGKTDSPVLVFENFAAGSGLGNNFIYSVFADSKNRVWFATDGKGITVYENGRFRNFSEETGLKSKIVYSIVQEKNGHIWFSSSNAGLFEYNGKTFRNLTSKDGLNDPEITGLSAALSPVIFIIHPGGIDVLEPLSEKFSYLGKEAGVGDINSNLNVVTADPVNDLVWIGTDKSLVKLSAREFIKPYSPLLRLNSVKVFLTETDTLLSHKFSYNRNHFTFDFVGIWYQAPDRVQYQVMLEGYDLDWITTRNSSVTYSSLGPGNYVFRVRASLNSDFSDAPVVSYYFVVQHPFWRTFWFIGLAILFTSGFIVLFIRSRERRLIREENIKKEKLVFQLQTLKNQVNPHFLFNSFSTLSAVIDENKAMALDYVQKLSAFFRNILEYRDKSVITLREELSLADTYYYLQKKRYGANFNLEIDIPDPYLSTYIPPMTLQMIIENAVKHNVISADKPLTVTVSVSNDMIVITNAIRAKKNIQGSTGVGLQNIGNRYRLLISREIKIDNSAGVFTVSLPVINSIPT